MKVIMTQVNRCTECPHVTAIRTPDAGYAYDYYCKLTGTKLAGYVEVPSELPEGIAQDCPLEDEKA